ncbi:unnamed protein product [Rotaria sp. Silwood1]|nr:unnamed protein product [Rotaria sp. Silwood1]CAF1269887.1 unnamed protein product [Rotaria sp. Silwood1]CAF1272382.1 unnamed protein product [Rotaria sp. Silwood1]CAF3481987.1 unnamed protein product [Rotaria sp. Silwood1]CAF3502459.1 unnamed protein product [Rotaria sp. Silwood1]
MQSLPLTSNIYPDCYLQIRRAKQTIFTDVAETTTVYELKQIIGNILRIDPNIIRLSVQGQILDNDSKHLLEYGITTKEARPQNPFQLEFVLKVDDDSYENLEVIPYSMHNTSSNDE